MSDSRSSSTSSSSYDSAVVPHNRYPDEEAGQIPMAYVVRKPGSTISATQIMDFIANQASDTVHTDVLSQARLAFYKARDAFYSFLQKESNKKPTEIASVGLFYPVECKKTREDYVKQCRPTWVKHFDRQYCANKGFKGFWMIMIRGEASFTEYVQVHRNQLHWNRFYLRYMLRNRLRRPLLAILFSGKSGSRW